ncbi:predicted protein [Phaeodactylum tricornutum CCAP 1055/1]|uniref:G-protein coupled receptors family 2 profile 2 domain-containing protein n=3 Tax=Phaeodactylum tricornutum TaxID=2850 RepID=B7FYS7_PHATC|nr:predicted protein [Phaeodactylum tricornutum CCAP 1055/1]EEC48221.1 predicted protein [Phaeodactylum tricornutum CCAP 1055/1]|eukprot:XP_002180030.1 predicted protein [Phaeodactylum tricornutum CCAP 1055/1]
MVHWKFNRSKTSAEQQSFLKANRVFLVHTRILVVAPNTLVLLLPHEASLLGKGRAFGIKQTLEAREHTTHSTSIESVSSSIFRLPCQHRLKNVIRSADGSAENFGHHANIHGIFVDSVLCIAEAIRDHRAGKGSTVTRGTIAYAVGNQATCNFQGFLLQLAIGAPLYNCSLALCYLLTIMYDWSNDRLALMGRWVHMFIISFSVGTSILLLPLGQYNQITQVCWIIGYPSGCGNSSNIRSNIPCVRGNWSWNYGILLFYGPLWLCIVLTIIAMANIYLVLRATHTRMQRYSTQALNAMESNGTKIGNTTSEDRKSSDKTMVLEPIKKNSKDFVEASHATKAEDFLEETDLKGSRIVDKKTSTMELTSLHLGGGK